MDFLKFLCLQNLTSPSVAQDTVTPYVKLDRLSAPCMGYGKTKQKKKSKLGDPF